MKNFTGDRLFLSHFSLGGLDFNRTSDSQYKYILFDSCRMHFLKFYSFQIVNEGFKFGG